MINDLKDLISSSISEMLKKNYLFVVNKHNFNRRQSRFMKEIVRCVVILSSKEVSYAWLAVGSAIRPSLGTGVLETR